VIWALRPFAQVEYILPETARAGRTRTTRTGSTDPNYLKSKAKTVVGISGREHKKQAPSSKPFIL